MNRNFRVIEEERAVNIGGVDEITVDIHLGGILELNVTTVAFMSFCDIKGHATTEDNVFLNRTAVREQCITILTFDRNSHIASHICAFFKRNCTGGITENLKVMRHRDIAVQINDCRSACRSAVCMVIHGSCICSLAEVTKCIEPDIIGFAIVFNFIAKLIAFCPFCIEDDMRGINFSIDKVKTIIGACNLIALGGYCFRNFPTDSLEVRNTCLVTIIDKLRMIQQFVREFCQNRSIAHIHRENGTAIKFSRTRIFHNHCRSRIGILRDHKFQRVDLITKANISFIQHTITVDRNIPGNITFC